MLRGVLVLMLVACGCEDDPTAREMCRAASVESCEQHIQQGCVGAGTDLEICQQVSRGGFSFATAECCEVNLCEDTVSPARFDSCLAQIDEASCGEHTTIPGPCRTLP